MLKHSPSISSWQATVSRWDDQTQNDDFIDTKPYSCFPPRAGNAMDRAFVKPSEPRAGAVLPRPPSPPEKADYLISKEVVSNPKPSGEAVSPQTTSTQWKPLLEELKPKALKNQTKLYRRAPESHYENFDQLRHNRSSAADQHPSPANPPAAALASHPRPPQHSMELNPSPPVVYATRKIERTASAAVENQHPQAWPALRIVPTGASLDPKNAYDQTQAVHCVEQKASPAAEIPSVRAPEQDPWQIIPAQEPPSAADASSYFLPSIKQPLWKRLQPFKRQPRVTKVEDTGMFLAQSLMPFWSSKQFLKWGGLTLGALGFIVGIVVSLASIKSSPNSSDTRPLGGHKMAVHKEHSKHTLPSPTRGRPKASQSSSQIKPADTHSPKVAMLPQAVKETEDNKSVKSKPEPAIRQPAKDRSAPSGDGVKTSSRPAKPKRSPGKGSSRLTVSQKPLSRKASSAAKRRKNIEPPITVITLKTDDDLDEASTTSRRRKRRHKKSNQVKKRVEADAILAVARSRTSNSAKQDNLADGILQAGRAEKNSAPPVRRKSKSKTKSSIKTVLPVWAH